MNISDAHLNKIATHPLQTSYWADFRGEWGNKIIKTQYGFLTIHKIPFTNYKIGMFIKGPQPTQTILTDLKQIAKENNLIFIKLEPNTKTNPKTITLLKQNQATPGKTLFTPTTFTIDLTKSQDELLKNFHGKTRYNINYAQKHGIKTEIDNSHQAFNKYLKLKKETVHRQGFYDHSQNYHQLMWDHLNKAGIANLLTASYKNEILTAWVLFTWKDTLYYPYGSSTSKYKNLQPNSAILWAAIQFGQKNKLKTFDLWGREEGKGFTKFKEGFSPQVVEFLGTWDLVINPTAYRIYQFLDTLRWLYLRLKSKFLKPKF